MASAEVPVQHVLIAHRERLTTQLDNMRKNNVMCDVTVVCDTTEFTAHKVILSASSAFFHNKFTEDVDRLQVPEVGPDIMELILSFVYTGHVLAVGEANVQLVLAAAHHLRVTHLYHWCREQIVNGLTLQNLEHVWDVADLYSDPFLQGQVAQFAAKNFRRIVRNGTFIDLPAERLIALIGNDRLVASHHDDVLAGVLTWVKHDLERRHRVLPDIIPHVKFDQLSAQYVNSLDGDPAVMASLELLQALTKTMARRYQRGSGIQKSLRKSGMGMFGNLTSGNMTSGSLTSGNMTYGNLTSNNMTYGNLTSDNMTYGNLPSDNMTYGNLTSNNMTSGNLTSENMTYGNLPSDNMTYGNLTSNNRTSGNLTYGNMNNGNLTSGNMTFGNLTSNNMTFGNSQKSRQEADFGEGLEAQMVLPEVQRFQEPVTSPLRGGGGPDLNFDQVRSRQNTMTTLLNLGTGHDYSSGSATGVKAEPLLVVLGQDKDDSVVIHYYSLRTKQWGNPYRPPAQKKFASIVAHKDLVYMIGGKVNLKPSATVHVINVKGRRSHTVQEMTTPRCGMGVAELDGLIYVVGGYNKAGWLKEVECYDSVSDSWEVLASLQEGKEGVGVVVSGGKLYAVGGVPVPTTEVYDPVRDQWTKLVRMRHARVYHGIAVLEGIIYVVGGFGHYPDRVQYFDSDNGTWNVMTPRAPQQCRDTWCAAVPWDNRLLVMNSEGLLWDFDPNQETWTKLPSSYSLVGGYVSGFISATILKSGNNR